MECSIEYGFTRRPTGAATSVQKMLLVVSRLAKTRHEVQCTRTGGCIERKGIKIPMHLKNAVYTIKWWVKGVTHDKTVNPNCDELGTLSEGNWQARL